MKLVYLMACYAWVVVPIMVFAGVVLMCFSWSLTGLLLIASAIIILVLREMLNKNEYR